MAPLVVVLLFLFGLLNAVIRDRCSRSFPCSRCVSNPRSVVHNGPCVMAAKHPTLASLPLLFPCHFLVQFNFAAECWQVVLGTQASLFPECCKGPQTCSESLSPRSYPDHLSHQPYQGVLSFLLGCSCCVCLICDLCDCICLGMP
jgi:hypothetical protein